MSPATEKLVAEFSGASAAQADEAVQAAHAAFGSGAWRDAAFRRAVLLRFADLIEENRDRLMDTLIVEVGTPINLKANHIDTPVSFLRWLAEAAIQDRTRNLGFNATSTAVSTVAYRPVGVVAAFTAFNCPILIGATKIGAALAAGCTTVPLSSPQAPLTVLLLGDLVRRAGFPPGVVNIIAGGVEVGRALTEHPDVAKVTFHPQPPAGANLNPEQMETVLMSDATDLVLTELDDATGIARIIFNRPGVLNALDEATAAAFGAATARLLAQPGLRCVVLTGAGKAFMAGGDVGAFAADLPAADRTLARLLNHMHPALLNLRRCDAPVVAAVNGVAAGAGLSLVLAADYVIARASARFVLAYDKLGVPPDCGGSWFLARKVGRAKAFELMLLGATLTAEAAVAAGIANEAVADEAFDARTRDRVERIAAGPTCAFGMFKRLLDTELPLAAHMELEREMFMAATRTEDFRSAARAFVAKQAIAFKGH